MVNKTISKFSFKKLYPKQISYLSDFHPMVRGKERKEEIQICQGYSHKKSKLMFVKYYLNLNFSYTCILHLGTSQKAFNYFRVCVIKSVDSFNVSAFCVHECEGSNRMGSRPRRYLFTGHSNGAIQVSASSNNQNMIFKDTKFINVIFLN